jgi:dihydrofolate reductase
MNNEQKDATKVVAIMSMSLDGFVADSNHGVNEVFDWYFTSGDVEIETGGADNLLFKVSQTSADYIQQRTAKIGSVITGRRTFDVAEGWGGDNAWGPAFVLTHTVPAGWPRANSNVSFVTDGLEAAVINAKIAAKGKNIAALGADTIQQLINAGLLDEIQIDIAAIFLGSGVRLFENLRGVPMNLGSPTAIQGVGVTHLCYRVLKD